MGKHPYYKEGASSIMVATFKRGRPASNGAGSNAPLPLNETLNVPCVVICSYSLVPGLTDH